MMNTTLRIRLGALLLPLLVGLSALPLRAQEASQLPSMKTGPSLEELEARRRELAKDIEAATPAFEDALEKVTASGLSPDEAKQAHQGQLESLPDGKRQLLEEVQPAIADYESKLLTYFQVYDQWGIRKMDQRSLEAYNSLSESYLDLRGKLDHGQVSKLEKMVKDMGAAIIEYWKWRETISGPDGHKRLVPLRLMSRTTRAAELEIERLRMKTGEVPRTGFWQRIGNSLSKIKRTWLNLRTKTALISPAVRLFAYLGNPWKKPDPERMSSLLREMGERFGMRAKIDLTIDGSDRIPQGKKIIFAPSHRSTFVDSLTMVRVLPGNVTPTMTLTFFPEWFRPIAQRFTQDEPGIIFANAMGVNVVDQVAEAVKTDRTVLFFPEGNVPGPIGEIRPLRSGLLFISEKLLEEDLAVVPVTIEDPFDGWGEIPYASGDRALGIKLGVHYERPLNARAVYAMSRGEQERLLLNLIRERWHRRLEPEFERLRATEAAPMESDEFSCEVEGAGDKFELLHADE